MRGWLITGRTGSGKTQCAINTITFQLFQNVKMGRLLRRSKGHLLGNPCENGRALRARRRSRLASNPASGGRCAVATPAFDQYHLQSERSRLDVCQGHCRYGGLIDWRTWAKSFFPTKAQIAIQTGSQIFRHIEAYVRFRTSTALLHQEDANAAIETLMNKAISARMNWSSPSAETSASRPNNWAPFRKLSARTSDFPRPGNLRSLLREPTDILGRPDRRRQNRVHCDVAKIPDRAIVYQDDSSNCRTISMP